MAQHTLLEATILFEEKRAATDYTARLVPSHAGALIPLEAKQILWLR
jgi:hypothetical protein